MHRISSSASLGQDVTLDVERLTIGPEAVIGDHTVFKGEEVTIGEGVRIGNRVSINAERISVARGGRIEDACSLSGTGAAAKLIQLGDHFYLGSDSKLLIPIFVTGDYVSIHNHLLANGYDRCLIGHNTWIGQNCVLNATGPLTIGNNVGIGAYSSVFTHGYFGELLEGCEIFSVAPVNIEDDAWLVGTYNVVSPGVTIGRRAIVLTSSVVTRDVPPERCVAGIPAQDLTDRIKPFKPVSVDQKLEMMKRFVEEYVTSECDTYEPTSNGFRVEGSDGKSRIIEVRPTVDVDEFTDDIEGVVYAGKRIPEARFGGITVFDLGEKTYEKRGHRLEASVISFMNSYRARFVPAECPRVEIPEVEAEQSRAGS